MKGVSFLRKTDIRYVLLQVYIIFVSVDGKKAQPQAQYIIII